MSSDVQGAGPQLGGGGRHRKGRPAVAASAFFIVVLVALAAACGGRAGDGDVVSVATAKLGDVRSYRFEGSMRSLGVPLAGDIEFEWRGEHDIVAGTVRTTAPTAGEGLETRYVGATTYLSVESNGRLPTPWAAYPTEDTEFQYGLAHVQDALDELDAIGGARVEQGGEADVRGVPTRMYRVTHAGDDARRYMARLGGDRLPPQEADFTVTVEFWLDDDDLTRRLRTRTKAGDVETVLSTDYYDFNDPLPPVTAPPEDEVTRFGSRAEYEAHMGRGVSQSTRSHSSR